MKNYFCVVRGRRQGVFKTEQECKELCDGYFDSKYKGFDTKYEAEKYLLNYIEHDEPHLYAIKRGFVPGIYYDREEAAKQIIGFENAVVRKYKTKNLDLAEKFMASEIIDIPKINKEIKQAIKKEKTFGPLTFKNSFVCFVDFEANEHHAISIGAVIANIETLEIVETFYSTCRYNGFEKMNEYCAKISKLSTEEILSSEDIAVVYEHFLDFLAKYDCNELCTWGNQDRKFLVNSLATEDKELEPKLKFIDIQPRISFSTANFVKNNRWGLKDMKYFYGLSKEVCHHALCDAKDTFFVFVGWKKESIINERVLEYQRIEG